MNRNLWQRFQLFCVIVCGPLALALPALAADETPHRGGTLVFGVNGSDPPTYDCHATNVFTIPMLITPHYSTLLKVDAAHYPQVVGDVAESWEVASDHRTYTFHLHKNVKFHDGSALTAEDVKATFERIRNPPPGVASVRQNLLVDVAAIDTPDPATVIFRLKQPNRAMLYTFTLPWNCLYSAAKLKEDANYPATHIMGSGPYKLLEHVRGSHWVGARFDNYFKPGLPYLDGFKGVFIQGPALTNAIQGGQVMVDFRSQSVADKDRLVQALGDKVTVEESPWLNALMIVFNTEHKPFDDPRVRRALSLALDRWAASAALQKTTILRSVGGVMRPGYSLAASEAELTKLPGFSHDIAASRAEARRLLKEAGQEHLTFKLLNRSNPPNPFVAAGVFLLDQWHQIGVEVENGPVLESQWSAAMNAGNFDVALDVQADTIDEPDFQLARYLSNDIAPNRPRFIDRTLDDLYKAQSDAPDATARYQALRRYEAHFMDEAYMVPILWWHRIVVLPKTIHGWHMSPTHLAFQDLEQVWLSPAP